MRAALISPLLPVKLQVFCERNWPHSSDMIQLCRMRRNEVTELSRVTDSHNVFVQLNIVLLAACWATAFVCTACLCRSHVPCLISFAVSAKFSVSGFLSVCMGCHGRCACVWVQPPLSTRPLSHCNVLLIPSFAALRKSLCSFSGKERSTEGHSWTCWVDASATSHHKGRCVTAVSLQLQTASTGCTASWLWVSIRKSFMCYE